MSSPAGASVADQLARWGFTAEMQSFASQLQASCFYVTRKFPSPKLVSCTSTWIAHTNQLDQVFVVCALAELDSCHVTAVCICTSAPVTVQLLATRHQALSARDTVHISVQCVEPTVHHILVSRSASLPPIATLTPVSTPTPAPTPFSPPTSTPSPPLPPPLPPPLSYLYSYSHPFPLHLPLPLPLPPPSPLSASWCWCLL